MSEERSRVTLEDMVNGFTMARIALITVFPYLSHLLCAIRFCTDAPLPTARFAAAIDRSWRVYFSPEGMGKALEVVEKKFGALPVTFNEICAFILLHEAFHIFADHHERSVGKNSELWGIACDFEINPTIAEMLPTVGDALAGVLYFPQQYNLPSHMPAEWYYEQLLNTARDVIESLVSIDALIDTTSEDEGSAEGDAEGAGSNKLTDIIKRAIILQTAKEIVNHSKDIGDVPADLVRIANLYLTHKVDWRAVLRKFIQRNMLQERARVGDFTYKLPSKKTQWQRSKNVALLPSVVAHKPMPIAVIIDTSGSMSEDELSQAVAETRAICRAGGYFTYIISCDADVHRVERVWGKTVGHEQIKRLLVGGGGTVLTKALDVAQNKLKAKLAVVLTDGWSDWKGAEQITIPTIVACIGKHAAPKSSIPQHFVVVYTHKEGEADEPENC